VRIFALSTPPMHGEDVKKMQRALRDCRYGDFMRGAAIDGVYGVYTAQAVYRAKYWLGYAKPNQAAGLGLYRYLTGEVSLTTDMRERRKRRLDRLAARPLRLKALDKMRTYIGITESPPGSNRCAITAWWGWVAAWCAMTVSRAYVEAGSKAFARGTRWASVSYIVDNAALGNYGLSLTKDPKPGDLTIFRFPGATTRFSHVGMVESLNPLKTIEANTSPDKLGSQDNGGMCCRKDREDERRAGMVKCYVHVSR